jgi:hypothetical protein
MLLEQSWSVSRLEVQVMVTLPAAADSSAASSTQELE